MDEVCYGLLGYRPTDPDLDVLSFRQFCVALRGHELAERKAWTRTLHLSNAWTGENLTYEDLFGGKKNGRATTRHAYGNLKNKLLKVLAWRKE